MNYDFYHGLVPGFLQTKEQVEKLYSDMGYPFKPINMNVVNGAGIGLTINGLANNANKTYWGSFFFRSDVSNFLDDDEGGNPETPGNAIPFFFGQSVLQIKLNQCVGAVRVIVTEYGFKRYGFGDGIQSISRLDTYDLMDEQVIRIGSLLGNTRYWCVQVINGVDGLSGWSFDMFWSGIGGIERYYQ